MQTTVAAAEDALLTEAPAQEVSDSILESAVGRYEASENLRGNMGLRVTTWNGTATLSPIQALTDPQGSQWHQVSSPKMLAHIPALLDLRRERNHLLKLHDQKPVLLSAMAGQKDIRGMLRL